jgi:uncharacterized surface protein with fasciclin (FAS1) repeats
MIRSRFFRAIAVSGALVLTVAACGDDDDGAAPTDESSDSTTDDAAAEEVDTAELCSTDELVEAVEAGPAEGTLAGMTDDPVGTAASSNPVLTTLVTAVTAADLVPTLNGAPALTVFAPTDCAFAQLDPATLEAALADPTGLLTTVLGFHVITERIEPADMVTGDLTTFTGATLPIEVDGDTITLNGGQAQVLVPGIQTANATVYLIDNVMLPPMG